MNYESRVRAADNRIAKAQQALQQASMAEALALQHVMEATALRGDGRIGAQSMTRWFRLVEAVRDDVDTAKRGLERAKVDRMAVDDQAALFGK